MAPRCTNTTTRARREHRDWGTLIFNYDRHEVRSFLLSSALLLAGGIPFRRPAGRCRRLDALPRLLAPGRLRAQQHGGNENLEAIDFLRELNTRRRTRAAPARSTIAEESTAWPMVSRPADGGGLGFCMKWNMGWMHDTLDYFSRTRSPPPPPRPAHLRHDVRLQREFRAAAVARRGRAPEGLAARQDAGRRLAAVRQPAAAVYLHVDLPGQEAAVHGRRIRRSPGSGTSATRCPGSCSSTPSTAACSGWSAT